MGVDLIKIVSVLHYEPNNATAKEFYPLILEKLQKVSVCIQIQLKLWPTITKCNV